MQPVVGACTMMADDVHSDVHFGIEQRKVLKDYFYEKGIRSVGKENNEALEMIAKEIDCPIKKVKVVTVSGFRKRTAFQVFCHDQACSSTSSVTIAEMAEKWKTLPQASKEEWRTKGNDVTKCCTKKTAIRDLISSINSNLVSLSKLGVEGYTVALNLETSDCRILTSSEKIDVFVDSEGIEDKFFKYACGLNYQGLISKKKKTVSYDEMVKTVRTRFKQKYMEATGKGRIPYSCLANLNCSVLGLPSGIVFKQPSSYNSQELRNVFDHLEEITFVQLNIPSITDSIEESTNTD